MSLLTRSSYASFMHTATVTLPNGIEICYEIGGPEDAPTILLIMGLGAQLLHWPNYFVQALIQQGFRVIRFDNRDIGKSSRIKTDTRYYNTLKALITSTLGLGNQEAAYTIRDMAEDVHLFMNAIELNKAHVVGASMGGMIAQVLAARHPQQVQTLSLLFSSNLRAFSQPPYPRQLRMVLARPNVKNEASAIEFGVRFLKTIGSAQCFSDQELESQVRTTYRRSFRPDGVARQFQAILSTGSLVAYSRKVSQPTLILHGSEDRFLPPSHGRRLAKDIKHANLNIINGMAHDIPQYFTQRLVDYLTNHIQNAS